MNQRMQAPVAPVTVIIPTMNRVQSLDRTIKGLISGSVLPQQIIVVDQSKELKLRQKNEAIKNNMPQGVDYVYIIQNEPSSTKARNLGMLHCSQPLVIFSDDDVDVEFATINNINEIMRDETIAMIAGTDVNSMARKEGFIGYLFYTKSYLNRKIGHVTLSLLGRFPKNIGDQTKTQWAMGFFFVVRKNLLQKWKLGWDENLVGYAYAEDLDFSYTYYKLASLENKKCIMSSKIKVNHIVSQEYRIPSQKQSYMYIIHRQYLSYKHFNNILSRVAITWTNFGEFIKRCIKRERPLDIIRAQFLCARFRSELRQGRIPPEILKSIR